MRKSLKAAHQKKKSQKIMSYLQNIVLDMKERIMLIFYRLRGARTEKEAARQIERLENLIVSFKDGIENGKKPWTDKD